MNSLFDWFQVCDTESKSHAKLPQARIYHAAGNYVQSKGIAKQCLSDFTGTISSYIPTITAVLVRLELENG